MKKILLVEDSKPTIDLINTTLTGKGYKVAFALNGSEAISTAIRWKPSLILMDITMPKMDGYVACQILKENEDTKHIPIIFLSALTQTFDKVKAFKVGGVDYISKPIEIEELLARIHTHITISNLQNELFEANEKLEEKVKTRTQELYEANIQLKSSISELSEKTEALKESEERYRLLFNNIMYPIFVSTFEGNFLFMNQKAAENFGVESSEIFKYNSIDLWIDLEQRKEFFEELLAHGFVDNLEVLFRNIHNENITAIISSNIIDYYGHRAILTVFNDITKQKKLEIAVLTNTIDTEEKERKRFAQELHDGLGPLLSAAKMYLQWISLTEDKQDIPNLLNKTNTLIDEAHKACREISHNLSPHILQNFGFVAAVKNFVEHTKISQMLNVNISNTYENDKKSFIQLGINRETILYRVLCESINNTLKHAQATKIIISIQQIGNILEINYSDNGIGFDANTILKATTGLGLFNMKHRIETINGKFTISSAPSKGTIIKIQVEI